MSADPMRDGTNGPRIEIGVISDTHGLLRPEALAALDGVSLILHAGDVGKPEVLDGLSGVAPVRTVRGNVDRGAWADALPVWERIDAGGRSIHMIHDLADLDLDPPSAGLDAVVFGHSHQPLLEERAGVLFLNPGAAGPRRFKLPVSLARLQVSEAGVAARLITLDV